MLTPLRSATPVWGADEKPDLGVFVGLSQSDDPREATETSPGWFCGDYWYGHNTDGIAVSGVTGTDWTIMIDSVDFGDVTNWYAASGKRNPPWLLVPVCARIGSRCRQERDP